MLTKKNMALLKSQKCSVQKIQEPAMFPQYAVHFYMTEGQLLTLRSALSEKAKAGSAIADDLLAFLNNGMSRENLPQHLFL